MQELIQKGYIGNPSQLVTLRREAVSKINAVIEDDIEILAVVAINYAPDKSLTELWHGVNIQNALNAKGWNEEEKEIRFQHVCDELKALREAKI